MLNENERQIAFYITVPSACNYLPERQSVTVFADPFAGMSKRLYSVLVELGFRRSGDHVYTPHCPTCRSCLPARIPADAFQPNRSQRRTWERNRDLSVTRVPPVFHQEHYDLYLRYTQQRHAGGGMERYPPEQYQSFLSCTWGETWLYEFRSGEALLAVAAVDHLVGGLSAVYTFYDPTAAQRSLGTFSILWQIQETARLGLPHLYLGYLIPECRKMSYKSAFQPLQIHQDGHWLRYSAPSVPD